jgi:hypothetical protein
MTNAPDPQLESLYQQMMTAAPGDLAALADEAFARYQDIMGPRAGTTPSGLPYPSPTDPVSQGADAIRNLATALDIPRTLVHRFTPVTMTLGINSAVVPNSYFNLSLKAGQSVVVRATANLNNSVSGGARTATLRALRDGGVPAGWLNGVFAIPWVAGSTTTTCILLNAYTAPADETWELSLTAWANVANAVTFGNLEWEVIASAPVTTQQPAPVPEPAPEPVTA